jgi:DUF4097 and DUF4098 domain-containing protein YvlB
VSHDVDITVPRGATLVVHGRYGDLDIRNIDGSLEIDGNSSSVRLENIGGAIRMDINNARLVRAINVKGDVELKGSGNDIDLENIAGQVDAGGSWSGLVQMRALAKPVRWSGLYTKMTMQAVPGEVRTTTGEIHLSGVTGPLRIDSQNKDLNLTDVSGPTVVDLQRGDVVVRATTLPLFDMNLSSRGGDVELELPAGAKFNLNAETMSGDAFNGFGPEIRQEHTGRGSSLRGTGGGPSIDVHVTRGDISVRSGVTSSSAPAAKSVLRKLPGAFDQ